MAQPSPAGASVLAVNAGSSSLKFALYLVEGAALGAPRLSGSATGLQPGGSARMRATLDGRSHEPALAPDRPPMEAALAALSGLLAASGARPVAVAHRIVHGGTLRRESALLDEALLDQLAALSPLAPLHQPHNLAGVRAFMKAFPGVPQAGCFDTGFHATLPELERRLALPAALDGAGVRRYGFHGLSYRYVAARLAEHSPRAAGRCVLAHLGSGASLCATLGGRSVATTMGFSALDGLMMGTRSGALDPGVLLYLMEQGWDHARIERLLYRESGLLGVSGESADMRALRASGSPAARLAIDLFTRRVIRECGALAAVLGGIDLIAFTGGIGEHDTTLRAEVGAALGWLGLAIDASANRAAVAGGIVPIHAGGSAIEAWVVPTDEGRVAAEDALALVGAG